MKCVYMWSQAYIETDGIVRPCCAPIELGSLENSSLSESFSSNEANKLRAIMSNGQYETLPEVCRNCFNLPRLGDEANNISTLYPVDQEMVREMRETQHSSFLNNYEKIKQAFEEGIGFYDTSPIAIILQLGEHCNIRCIMCPQDHQNPKRVKSEYVRKVLEALNQCLFLTLTGGEPLVFKETWEILDHFQKVAPPVAQLSMLTNCLLLNKEKVEKYLGKINKVGLGINFDACTKETYERIRFGGKWETLIQNINDLNEFKRRQGKDWQLNMGFTIMKSNLKELKGAIELAANLGMGFGCGPVTGDVGPLKNVHTFFEENIFIFPHLGYSKEFVVDTLNDSLTAVKKLEKAYQRGAENNIKGVIAYAERAPQIDIPRKKYLKMRALNAHSLSKGVEEFVNRDVNKNHFLRTALTAFANSPRARWSREVFKNLLNQMRRKDTT